MTHTTENQSIMDRYNNAVLEGGQDWAKPESQKTMIEHVTDALENNRLIPKRGMPIPPWQCKCGFLNENNAGPCRKCRSA